MEAMTTNQNAASVPGAPWGLGWGLKDSLVWNFFGQLCSKRTFVSYQPDVSCGLLDACGLSLTLRGFAGACRRDGHGRVGGPRA